MFRTKITIILAVLFGLWGCAKGDFNVSELEFECDNDKPCAAGFMCVAEERICVPLPPDVTELPDVPAVDDVAADFPELTIIGAHPAWPWQDEMLAVAMHKANVYIDLSGWSPKYFPPSLVHYTNFALGDKVLFGSDYPVLTPERWMKDFEGAGFKEELHPKILRENANRLLKL